MTMFDQSRGLQQKEAGMNLAASTRKKLLEKARQACIDAALSRTQPG